MASRESVGNFEPRHGRARNTWNRFLTAREVLKLTKGSLLEFDRVNRRRNRAPKKVALNGGNRGKHRLHKGLANSGAPPSTRHRTCFRYG